MTAEEEAALRTKITEAEAQYHSLMTGTMARVLVDQNGERVEFTSVNRSGLYQYILTLKAQLPGAEAAKSFTPPIRFLF